MSRQVNLGAAREVAPVNPDLEKLAAVGARHGLKVAD